MTNCKNCGRRFKGKFCNNCGQAAETHTMNFHFLWHDIQHGLFHVDKGIFFTTKELFTRPGHTIREYLRGKRVSHFRPISMVLILAGVYALLYHIFHIGMLKGSVTVSGRGQELINLNNIVENLLLWIGEHYELVALAQLPFAALGTYLAFRKWGYNYVEHFILNAFITAQSLIVRIVLFPFNYAFSGRPALKNFYNLEYIINLGLLVWVLLQFFNTRKKFSILMRTLLSLLIYGLFYAIIFCSVVAVNYFFIQQP
ncbi:MAG: DUF3667 domain-containing protein [Ginsengibacter sp.]